MFKALSLAVAVALTGAVALPSEALAAKPEIYTDIFSKVALQGYDPVAYFTVGRPVKGSSAHVVTYKGVPFHFASAENKAMFRANPDAYAPEYGGHCAWAAAQGYTAKGDARYWKIVGGRLYLNYDAGVQRKWETNIDGFIAKADDNWPGILSK